jgi:methionine synthase / methylenetetrahydrofolate reductase(NADPH)
MKRDSLLAPAFGTAKKLISVELLAPSGAEVSGFMSHLDLLDQSGVEFVSVPDAPRARARMSSLHLAALANRDPKRRLKVFPHLTARDRNVIALQADLLGAWAGGVRDVLLVTGDPVDLDGDARATAVHDVDSIGLAKMVDALNGGLSPTGELIGGATGFGIGVAVNPSADNLEREDQRWLSKCEAGADFAVTQMVFDPEAYLRWRDRVGERSWRPHLVGIWPLLDLRNAEFLMSKVPGVKIPPSHLEELTKAGTSAPEAMARGLDLAHKTMQRLVRDCDGFSVIAPLNRVDVALSLVKRLEL